MEPHYSHFASQRETQIDDENRKNFFREINPDTQKADGHNCGIAVQFGKL